MKLVESSATGTKVRPPCPRCALLDQLSNDDWSQLLREGGPESRRTAGLLLKLTLRKVSPDLIRVKRANLSETNDHHLSELLVLPVRAVATDLFGPATEHEPSVQDWRRIWPGLTARFSVTALLLFLAVVIDDEWSAKESAREFLAELGDDPAGYSPPEEEPADYDALIAEADGIDQIARDLVIAQSEVLAAADATLATGSRTHTDEHTRLGLANLLIGLTAAAPLVAGPDAVVQLINPALIARLVALAVEKREEADAVRAAAEATATSQQEIAEAVEALAPLCALHGPDDLAEHIVTLNHLAKAPTERPELDLWLKRVPVLRAFVSQLYGESRLTQDDTDVLSQLTSWHFVGQVFGGKVTLAAEAEAVIEDVESVEEVKPIEAVEEVEEVKPVPVVPPRPRATTEDRKPPQEPPPVPTEAPAPVESAGIDPALAESLLRLVTDQHLGAAAWAADAEDREWGLALEILAIASALRGYGGPMSEALWARLQPAAEPTRRPPARVLSAALCLATTVSPYTGANDLLERLAEHSSAQDGTRELYQAVVEAARHGFSAGVDPIPAGTSDVPERVERARRNAEHQLTNAPSRKIKQRVATRVYRTWMAEDGLLGDLLAAVRDDRRDRLDDVRTRMSALNEKAIEKAIDEAEAEIRGTSSGGRVVADARPKLHDWAGEALDVVRSWVRAASQPEGVVKTDIQLELADRVRGAAQAVLDLAAEPADGALVDEDQLADRVVLSAVQRIKHLLDDGLDGSPEAELAEVLDSWLPFVHEAHVDRDAWDAVPDGAGQALRQAPYRTAEEAYAGFAQLQDHAGTARLLQSLEERGEDVETLRLRRDHDLQIARQALDQRLIRVRAEFDELDAYPDALSLENAVLARAYLVELREGSDEDLLSAKAKVDRVEAILSASRVGQVDDLRARIAESELSDDDRSAVEALLRDGALSAAHELFDAAAGVSSGALSNAIRYRDLQQQLWVEGIEAATAPDIFERAEQALGAGVGIPAFGPGPAEAAEGRTSAEALVAWQAMFREKRGGDFPERLQSVLGVLTLHGPKPKWDQSGPPKGTHLVQAITGFTPVQPAVSHEFGSRADGRYRVLVVWTQMSPEELVSLVLTDRKNGPHLLLYKGVLSRQARQALHQLTHQENAATARMLVIDDAVMLTMAFSREPSFATLEHLTLPFAQASVFTPDVAGNVPAESFRGRQRELAQVIDPDSGCFVYGGRQVGKSALLREARRKVQDERDPDRQAVYLDVKGLGLGNWRDIDEFWLCLLDELRRADIVTDRSSRAARADAVINHIRNWIDAEPGRRLLVLLDECDQFLDADAHRQFAVIDRLRGLMGDTGRRFKVVLAGLHQVQRFERQRNLPLAHLTQQPIQIGPMQRDDAVALIREPLLALGYALDDAATWRLLAETNRQAGLIQFFGQALLRALLVRRGPKDVLPRVIDRAFVDLVYRQEKLDEQMRHRFMLTVNLDEQYRCIAFVIALRNLQQGMAAGYTQQELQNDCAYWWEAGFRDIRPTLFKELVEEMIGLGVLARVNERICIRNPNVIRMLGSQSHVEAELLEFADVELPRGFDASHYRRELADGRRSPLTEEEIAQLVKDEPGLAIVGGSLALGIDKVGAALTEKLKARDDVEVAMITPGKAAEAIAAAKERTVLVVDCLALSTEQILAVTREVQASLSGMSRRVAMRRVILVAGPAASALWADAASAPAGLTDVVRIGLRRLNEASLTAWSSEESLEMERSAVRDIMTGTGGWPALVDRAIAVRRNRGWVAAAADVRAEAVSGEAFLSSVLDGSTIATSLVSILLEVGEPLTWADLIELAEVAPSQSDRLALEALQLIEETEDGALRVEPVLAEAWERRGRD